MQRSFAAVALVVIVIGAGCLSGPSPDSGLGGTDDVGPAPGDGTPPYPGKPADPTREAAVEYATAYERAAVYRDVHEPGAEVSLVCNGTLVEATTTGYYVVAACGGSVTYPDGRHGDMAPTGHPYFVNGSETIRIVPDYRRDVQRSDIYKADNDSENLGGPAGLHSRGFEVLNFDDADHTATVRITYLNATPPARVFSQSYAVPARGGTIRPSVTARKGAYDVTVRLDSGAADTFQWRLSEARADRVAIVVTPAGEVDVRPSVEPRMV